MLVALNKRNDMSETTAVTPRTPEENRIFFNRRFREKRAKGHSFQMITDYAAQCPVPFDQLHDLTPEERAEVERLRPEVEQRRRKAEQETAMRELAWKIGRGEPVEPEAIDFEAVKDIPATDEAHREHLAKLNMMIRVVDAGYLWECKEAKQRALAKAEADPSKHFLEYIEPSIQEIRDENAERERRFKEKCEALANYESEGTFDDQDRYEAAVAILHKYGVKEVTAEFNTDNFGFRNDPSYGLHDVSVWVHGADDEDIDDTELTLEELSLFDDLELSRHGDLHDFAEAFVKDVINETPLGSGSGTVSIVPATGKILFDAVWNYRDAYGGEAEEEASEHFSVKPPTPETEAA